MDADDFRVNGDNAIDFSNLVENGLVRVTLPLPLNVKLIDPATGQPSEETSVDLWRAVMPVFNVAITGPDGVLPIWPPGAPRPQSWARIPMAPTGRAAISTMRASLRFRNKHAAHSSPTPRCRWNLRRECSTTSRHSSRHCFLRPVSDSWLTRSCPAQRRSQIRTPSLNEVEQQGKVVFNRACGQCHGGTLHPSGSTPEAAFVRPIVRYHNISDRLPSTGHRWLRTMSAAVSA